MKPRSNPEPATVDDGDASGDELQATVTGDASTSRTNGKGFIDDDDDEPPEVDDNHVPAPTTDNGDSRKNDASRKHHDTRGNRSTTNHNNPQEGAKEGPAKRAVKKVNSQAHANFRRLKLRNKNSKGKGRGMSFKRRR
jgi:DNA replication regulator SLD2